MYNPPESGTDSLEYIGLRAYNGSMMSTGCTITGAIEFAFPPDSVLFAGAEIVVAKDSVAFQNTFGFPVFQWNSGTLNNTGESIEVRYPPGNAMDSVHYSSSAPWPTDANGTGASIVFCGNHYSQNDEPENWQASSNNTSIVVNGMTIFADPGQSSVCQVVGLEDSKAKNFFQAYPNPSNGNFTLLFPELMDDAIFSIHDPMGSLIHFETVTKGSSKLEKHMTLAPGIYLLELETSEDRQAQYLVVTE